MCVRAYVSPTSARSRAQSSALREDQKPSPARQRSHRKRPERERSPSRKHSINTTANLESVHKTSRNFFVIQLERPTNRPQPSQPIQRTIPDPEASRQRSTPTTRSNRTHRRFDRPGQRHHPGTESKVEKRKKQITVTMIPIPNPSKSKGGGEGGPEYN